MICVREILFLTFRAWIPKRNIWDIVNCGQVQWRDDEIDMLKLSEKFPDVLFTLTWYGEELKDIGSMFFYKGKRRHRTTQIIHSEFNPKDFE